MRQVPNLGHYGRFIDSIIDRFFLPACHRKYRPRPRRRFASWPAKLPSGRLRHHLSHPERRRPDSPRAPWQPQHCSPVQPLGHVTKFASRSADSSRTNNSAAPTAGYLAGSVSSESSLVLEQIILHMLNDPICDLAFATTSKAPPE